MVTKAIVECVERDVQESYLFCRALRDDEMNDVLLLVRNAGSVSDVIVGFYRGVILPAVGRDWDDYQEDRSLPTTEIKIAKSQWKTICIELIERFGQSDGLMWMNVGPSTL